MVNAAPRSSISRREWQVVLLYALALLVLTSAPYALAGVGQGDRWTFTGSLFGVEDGNSYLAKMRLGARGSWNFYLFYTAEAHESASLIYFPYIAAGHLVGLLVGEHDPALPGALILAYHVMRVVCDGVLIVVIYRFAALFLRQPKQRLTALILATLGGGVGWLLVLLGHGNWLGTLPPEFYIPEGFSFLVLLGLPHLALARAALLGGLLALIAACKRPNWRDWGPWAVLAGTLWLVLGLAFPLYLAVLYAVLGGWGLAVWVRQRAFPLGLLARCAAAAGVTLPLLGYYLLVFARNAALAEWVLSGKGRLVSPHPVQYVLAYGILAALAWVGGRWAWKRAATLGALWYALPVGWLVVVPVLVYLPINAQRRLAEAVLIPLAVLAVAGLRLLARRSTAWRRARALVFAVTLPSSVFIFAGSLLLAVRPALPAFRPAEEVAAFAWLDAQADPDAVVLSAFSTGNALPVWASVRVFLGHGLETLDADHKQAEVERFYGGTMTASERLALYADMRIRYVFYGPLERELAADPGRDRPRWAAGLELRYDRAGYRIYEVASGSGS